MILKLEDKYQNNSSIILKDESKVIDFKNASKMPYEIITAKLNIPGSDKSRYDNWYSIMHESYYFKERARLQDIITELLGVYLSKYMGLDSVEYELAVQDGELIGLLSKNFRKENADYVYASNLTTEDRKKIRNYANAKVSIVSIPYKKMVYDYIMRLYYAATFDLANNVLCERKHSIPHISTLFDYEKSFMETEEDSFYDPFLGISISGKTIRVISETHPLMKHSISKALGFDITKAFKAIESEYNISIPDEVKAQYQEFNSERKDFIKDKVYQKKLH